MPINFILLFIFISFILLFLCKKFNFLLDIKKEKHKKFSSNAKNYSLGGSIILIYFIYYYFKQNEFLYISFFVSIFFIGLLADLKIFNNPMKRFILQIIILYIFINLLDIKIFETRFMPIDYFLNNIYFNQLFTIFCLMILLNGSNFIDGLNTLLISYNIFIFLILLIFFESNILEITILKNLTLVLFIILIFNFRGQIILGDSGSYLLSLFTGLYLMQFASQNSAISPFFIVLLLWYPCFELLFSMIRRATLSLKPYKPDIHHLHQIFFKVLKIKDKNNIKHLVISLLINIYNFGSILIGLKSYNHSQTLILIIIINIIVYCLFYKFLKNNLNKI